MLAEEIDKYFDRITSHFDQEDKRSEESKENNKTSQCLAQLQYDEARQLRLAATADVK